MLKWLLSLLLKRESIDDSGMSDLQVTFDPNTQTNELLDAIKSLGFALEIFKGVWYIRTNVPADECKDIVTISSPNIEILFATLRSSKYVTSNMLKNEIFEKHKKRVF